MRFQVGIARVYGATAGNVQQDRGARITAIAAIAMIEGERIATTATDAAHRIAGAVSHAAP
ncbi:hypothetical protein ATCM_00035 [Stenotrophomonas sp. ATCM1_4]|nr:hypothetical protein ATCM_00035 [Stenotrophomonas sp. ATCM1_4]